MCSFRGEIGSFERKNTSRVNDRWKEQWKTFGTSSCNIERRPSSCSREQKNEIHTIQRKTSSDERLLRRSRRTNSRCRSTQTNRPDRRVGNRGRATSASPSVVHCRLEILAVDMLFKIIDRPKANRSTLAIDVMPIVNKIREDRAKMVQTKDEHPDLSRR